jgi:hypothetical protein
MPWPWQQLKEEIGIVRIKRPEALEDDLGRIGRRRSDSAWLCRGGRVGRLLL